MFLATSKESRSTHFLRFCSGISSLPSIYSALLEDFFTAFKGLVFSAIFPLSGIFSALLEDSKKVSLQQGFARYLEYLRN